MYNGAGRTYNRDAGNMNTAAAAAAGGGVGASSSSELSESDNEPAGFNKSLTDYNKLGINMSDCKRIWSDIS